MKRRKTVISELFVAMRGGPKNCTTTILVLGITLANVGFVTIC